MLFLVLAATLSADPVPDPFLAAWKSPPPAVTKIDPFADAWAAKLPTTIKKTVREIVPSVTDHVHSCPNCKYKWSHDDSNKGNVETHTCPKCGTLVFGVYRYNAEVRERSIEQKVPETPPAVKPAETASPPKKEFPTVSLVPTLDVFNSVPQNCPT